MDNQTKNTSGDGGRQATYPLEQYSVQPKGNTAGGGEEQSPFYQSAAPAISMPKGGGALKGIDEKFSVNAINGTAGLQVALPLTPGRNGFTPSLSLSYNSGGGNSEFGLGWGLSLPAIQRRTDKKLPLYNDEEDSDVFLLAGAEDLVPQLDQYGSSSDQTTYGYTIRYYRPRIEGLFARIEHISKSGAGSWWRVTTKDNITTYYGLTASARVSDPADAGHIYKWLPELVIDHKGNVQYYNYLAENDTNVPEALHEEHRIGQAQAQKYLKRIAYCNTTPYTTDADLGNTNNTLEPSATVYTAAGYLMEAVLDYGDQADTGNQPLYTPASGGWSCRKDPFSDFHPGFEVRTWRRCRRVLVFHSFDELKTETGLTGPVPVRSLDLTYYQDSNSAVLAEADFITAIQETGYRYDGATWSKKSLPAMTMEYAPLQWNTTRHDVSSDNAANAPQGLTGSYQWTDLWGEGLPGILTEEGGGWFYKTNLGDARFTPAEAVASKPSFGNMQWADLDADGRRQVVSMDGAYPGYFELNDEQQWEPFRGFEQLANVDCESPYTKMLDLDGDGRADLLIADDRVWSWYKNEGKKGYATGGYSPLFHDEDKGPRLVLNDALQSIYLADINGDGLTDLVRIRNGEVCYWPNMGYGKFGAKVTMSNAPRLDFLDVYNPLYLTLADISGTGAADLVYLGQNKCLAWVNLAGNGWSEATEINPLPSVEPYSKIAILDFLGNGTGCLVWSSPLPQHSHHPLRYIDLMGGVKPYLMQSYHNGMGKTVSVSYRSSVQYYLADKQAGTPWATRLPFPVQCIDEVTTTDAVSGSSYTQAYTYHHGYYDHEEREFRGFGRVDTVDIEQFTVDGSHTLDQSPVLTKTWYHTGAWLREQTLLDAFEQEYYDLGSSTMMQQAKGKTTLPTGLTSRETREAHRALKGVPLRQEVYALDGTDKEDKPYTVAITSYATSKLQPATLSGAYAVFYIWQSEQLSISCERELTDARIAHSLTLETDEYGNVLKAAQVAYPRQLTGSVPSVVQDEQAKMHITVSAASYTAKIITPSGDQRWYRLPVAAEANSYELYVAAGAPTGLWTNTTLAAAITSAGTPVDFTTTMSGGSNLLRCIAGSRTVYLANDMSTPMTLGTMDTLGFAYQHYTLAWTEAILNGSLNGLWNSTILETEGGHITTGNIAQFPQSGSANGYIAGWWIASGTVQYGGNPASDFYTPVTFTDPWGNVTTVTMWGSYHLLPQSTTDALSNVHTVTAYDWRCLQPTAMKDQNDNITEILYDDLCMPVAMAVKGKGSEADYLQTLNGNALNPEDNTDMGNQSGFWGDPESYAAELLGRATWRCVYDLHTRPTAVATIGREQHYEQNNNSNVLIRISYTDGLGRVAMHKVQAEDYALTSAVRWTGSGKTVYNNKGNAVMQYEPYYSATHEYDPAAQAASLGVSAKVYYDPLNRAYRTELPDGSYSHTTWDNWRQTVYDANDTVQDSDWYVQRTTGSLSTDAEEADAAAKAALHYDTPTVMHLDSLARPFYTVQTNRSPDSSWSDVAIESYIEQDIQGNRLAVHDGNGNTPLTYRYNMVKSPIWQSSMDSGVQQNIPDAAGQPLYGWDAAGTTHHTVYDTLRRPLRKETDGAHTMAILYGENENGDKSNNMRGQVFQVRDGGGILLNVHFDFKNTVLETWRLLLEDQTQGNVDWRGGALWGSEQFNSYQSCDALGRPVSSTDPGNNVTGHSYDKGGMLKVVTLNGNKYVQDIHYDAKGRREAIWYGNNTKTSYTYNALTYRLARLLTVNLTTNDKLQDLNYCYDAVGNITRIRDDAQQAVFFKNAYVPPLMGYTYDALYRLVTAQGREQTGSSFGSSDNWNDNPWMNAPNAAPFDDSALQNYTQSYSYDAVGNITSLQHSAASGSYTRDYSYTGNRLNSTTVGADTYSYDYDSRGNMIKMPHIVGSTYNEQNEFWYANIEQGLYNQYSGGQRIRKVTHKNSDETIIRIYLGSYELYRKYKSDGSLDVERSTVHVSDDTGRIAMYEALNTSYGSDGSPAVLGRYIYSNHLGSASLELNENGDIISYEEYHPYGTTAYQAMNSAISATAKRYRYTGKERDEETGLYYHGARYYIPWLARWAAVDPLESKYSPQSSYMYCSGNPVSRVDPDGKGDKPKGNQQVPLQPTNLVAADNTHTGFGPQNNPGRPVQRNGDLDKVIGIWNNAKTNHPIATGVAEGAVNFVGSSIEGIARAVTHPLQTAETLTRLASLSQPGGILLPGNAEFAQQMGTSVVNGAKKFKNADAHTRTAMATEGALTIGTMLLGNEGAAGEIADATKLTAAEEIVSVKKITNFENHGAEFLDGDLRMVEQPLINPKDVKLTGFNEKLGLVKTKGGDYSAAAIETRDFAEKIDVDFVKALKEEGVVTKIGLKKYQSQLTDAIENFKSRAANGVIKNTEVQEARLETINKVLSLW